MPNDRRRAMLRLTGDWNQYHPPFTNKCPCCGKKVRSESWREESFGEVEHIEECGSCGYKDHYAYGVTLLEVGDFSEGFSYSSPEKETARIYREFEKAIAAHRKAFRTLRRKAYRKSAEYRREKK